MWKFLYGGFLLALVLFSKTEAFYWDLTPRIGFWEPLADTGRSVFRGGQPVYELELSFHFDYPWVRVPWKVWTNVSYFAPEGRTLYCHHEATTWIVPVSLGLKYSWFCWDCLELYAGAGVAGSWMKIKDDSPGHRHHHGDFDHADFNHHSNFNRDFDKESYCANHDRDDTSHRLKKAAGFVLKSGLRYAVCNWIYLDFFADYYYSYFHVKSRDHHFKDLFVGLKDDLIDPIVNFDDRHRHKQRLKRRESINMSGFILGGGIGMVF